ncbi:biotin--protein ligase 2 isoform X2 [Spinacia oleracea]|uniref:Biotin--protein ligase 2 isoform X2 n=1 Tax=Spinacia oleracea TaxID=3562 RepID=A0A9R0IWG2_SPIOL|nr:biotin--protein ligase 2-like isoform X2 [Spinacia oleracea]
MYLFFRGLSKYPTKFKFKACFFLSSLMESQSEAPIQLFLCGKSYAEKEIAKTLQFQLQFPNSSQFLLRLQSQLQKPTTTTSFRVDSFFNSLSTSRFGRFLIWSPRLPSTHDIVSMNFSELPVGAVCVADLQFKGRGRSANVWESPPGCLMFSFTLQMEDGRIVPLVQYIASLALTEAIKDLCFENGLPQLGVKIKWPNDLFLNGLKVGGILCTSTYKSKKFNISVGIGLNVDNKQPTTCLNARLQQIASMSCQLRKDDILASFFNKFENFFDLFLSKGFKPLEELYYQTWLHSGQRVTIQDNCEGQPVDNVVTIQGLTSSGYLLAIGDDGQMCELHPDGNRFRRYVYLHGRA